MKHALLPYVTQIQLSSIAPSLSITCLQRRDKAGISFNLDTTGYAATADTTLFPKSWKVSWTFSRLRSSGSAQAHTFSWGLRSGEYFGHSGSIVIFISASATLAAGAWRSFSPYSRIWYTFKEGKAFLRKGPSFYCTLRMSSSFLIALFWATKPASWNTPN